MVLEHLFPENWLEKKGRYGFILGFIYSLVSIALARVIFSSDPAIASVAFTSLLILPELYKLMALEEHIEDRERKTSLRRLFRDNRGFVKTYLAIGIGIFLAYALATIVLPSLEVNSLFRAQLELREIAGSATSGIFSASAFISILINNWWVLLACFLVALLTGDGAIFLISWNASVWGTIFGATARNAAIMAHSSPFLYLLLVLLIVSPHALLEILSYILSGVAGGVISKDVLLEKFDSARFWEVFRYNLILLLIAVAILIAGAALETAVLVNVGIYKKIIVMSIMASGGV